MGVRDGNAPVLLAVSLDDLLFHIPHDDHKLLDSYLDQVLGDILRKRRPVLPAPSACPR